MAPSAVSTEPSPAFSPAVSPSPKESPRRSGSTAPGTATLEGHIYDESTKSPLGQSEVMIPELNVETFSNPQGKYHIRKIPVREAPYEIMIIRPGYEHHYDKQQLNREQKYKIDYLLKKKGF